MIPRGPVTKKGSLLVSLLTHIVVYVQSGEVPAAGQDGQATTAPGGQATTAAEEKPPRPQKRAITIPSAFKYLTSTSFKREPPPPPPGIPSIPDAPEEVLAALAHIGVLDRRRSRSNF